MTPSTTFNAFALTALVAIALLVATPDSHAQFNAFITGQVVDPQGLGVPGVDIDVDNLGSGGDPDLLNDGTDPGGFFTTTVESAGTYEFFFRPPPPPATSMLIKTLSSVAVPVGTKSLGVIALEQGVDVQGTCVGPTGLPAGGVNFDLYDVDGNLLKIAGGFTSLFGTFRFAAPAGPIEWRFNTLGVITETLAPTVLKPTLTGPSMNFGNVVLPRGYRFTATLLRPPGFPLGLTDTDTFDSATGEQVYTPGDDSNASGVVNLVLGAGVYDIYVCPNFGTLLVATGAKNVPINSDFNAGSFMLQTGSLMSGVVRDGLGTPVQGVNIDVEDSQGNDIFLCGDSTNATGLYNLVVPNGTWRIEFHPAYSLPLGSRIQENKLITVNTVNNVVLPDCPTHTPYGNGLAGKGAQVPTLAASGGSARLGNPDYALEISGGLGRARAMIVSGFQTASTPFLGGTLLVGGPGPGNSQSTGMSTHGVGLGAPGNATPLPLVLGTTIVRLDGVRGVAGTGSLTWPSAIPNDPILAGFTRYVQVIVEDKTAVQGAALSNGIAIDYCE